MLLHEKLLHIYPDLDLFDDVILQDNGDDITYIAQWNDPRPQPTEAELNAADAGAKRSKLIADIDNLTASKIAGLFGKQPNSMALSIKQQNAQARASELQEKESAGLRRLAALQDIVISGGTLTAAEQTEKAGLLAGVLTAAEQTEKAATQSAFVLIKSIRMHGKQLETDLATADPDTFDINTGWPV